MGLGYAKHDPAGNNSGNSRNGKTSKSVRSQNGEIELDIPRDRNSTFEPTLIGKHEKQLNGFDDRIISLYSRGLSTRDIQAHFKEVYGVDVSAGFISQVTNAVMDDVKRWQQRPLDAFYPIVYLDCIVVKSQDGGAVTNKSVYLALGINGQGEKELLGLWIAKTEGAKFWLSVMTELKNRGLQDIFIACCDGLKGFHDAIEAVYPHTRVQLCIVHQVRNSLRYVGWKERKAVAADLRTIAKRLNFDYTIWTENKLSVSQPISLFLLFACAHLCSIGLRSGEYVGKYSTIYPASMMTC